MKPVINSPQANITFSNTENTILQSNISHVPAERISHSAGIYNGGCKKCQAPHRCYDSHHRQRSRLVFEGNALNSYYARKTEMASKIIFKKVFTFYFLCVIIPFAHARFSGYGVNPVGVITCRILGSEANI